MLAVWTHIATVPAAFLPMITLTGQAGQAWAQFSSRLQAEHCACTAAASVALTVFDCGRRQAGVDSAVTAQGIAEQQYGQAIQAAFRDTGDALAELANRVALCTVLGR